MSVLVLLGLLAILAYGVYEQGRRDAAGDIIRSKEARDALQENVRALEQNKSDLRERVAILERATQVERQAYSHVDRTLRELQDQILDLKEELAFYRGIVTARGKTQALDIQSFKVQQDGAQGQYRYKLVLTRVVKNDKVVKGTVSLSVAGEQAGSFKELSLAQLSDKGEADLKLKFRYFQRLEGLLTLPKGFVPHRVLLQVTTAGKKQARLEKAYNWPSRLG